MAMECLFRVFKKGQDMSANRLELGAFRHFEASFWFALQWVCESAHRDPFYWGDVQKTFSQERTLCKVGWCLGVFVGVNYFSRGIL